MRIRLTAVALAFAGLLVAVAVGLAANSVASRSFTPGADALPSAGSLAPTSGSGGSGQATTAPATIPGKTTTTPSKPKPKTKPFFFNATAPTETTPATT